MEVKNLEELQKVFVELNKERKNNKDFLNKNQIEELVKLKDEIKSKLENPKVLEAEIISGTEETAETRT
jgi:hypothetical protein